MEFEWDPTKSKANINKHGISFEEAASIWRGPLSVKPDYRIEHEDRLIAMGLFANAIVLVVVYIERRRKIRIISARKATPKERKKFYEEIYK